ncbi:Type IV secretory pathway, VirB4 component [Methylacidimicrobium sp. AP8]|uniref:VirB4 family type IV secretion system protein n=1 Tax=Methylacidimicrobium sp. AP8 TaxID=2730359 RepID=UPI0018C005D7|nr:type IV secretion system protein VirB4 [Methylacidimicrobium sp. AP8]CAB4243557.1 Type IV secretory pathway, VirB4 component [Methylacidimicrobium sp. AP8]
MSTFFAPPRRLWEKTQLFHAKKTPVFHDWSDACPYVGLYDRFLVDKFGAVHAFYRTYFPQADIASPERLSELQEQLRLLLTQLPPEIAQTQHLFTCNGDYGPVLEEFARIPSHPSVAPMRAEKARRLSERMVARKLVWIETHTILTAVPSHQSGQGGSEWTQRVSGQGAPSIERRRITRAEFDAAVHSLEMAESVFVDTARRAGARVSPLDAHGIAEYFFRLWNPGLAVENGMRVNYDYNRMPFVDAWMLQEVRVEPDHLRIGDYAHGLVSLVSLPLETRPRDMERMTVGLPFRDVRVSLIVRRTSKLAEMEKLRNRIDWADQRMRMGLNLIDMLHKPHDDRRESGVQNIEAWMQIEEAQSLLSDVRSGADDLVQIQLTVHSWHREASELRRRAKQILNRFGDLSRARGWIERSSLLPVFMTEMPGVYAPLLRPLLVRARMAADLMPIFRGLETQERPVHLFGNTTGGLVALDLEDKRNEGATMLYVSGVKGSGKSVLAQLIVLRHIGPDSILLIIDKGSSYDRLVELLGGTTVRLDAGHPICFNPFQVYVGATASGELREPEPAELAKVINCLEILANAGQDEGLSTEGRNILEAITRQTFSNAVKNREQLVTLSDFTRQLAYRSDARFLAERLKPFSEGRYRDWFNGETQFHLKSRVVHFDFEHVAKDETLAAALIPMSTLFVSDMILSHPEVFKILVFGEMWQHINNPTSANLIVDAFKTYRKKRCAIVGESQAILDLTDNSKVAKAVIQNVDTWIMLPQGSEQHVEFAVKELELTKGQRDCLLNLRNAARLHPDGEVELWREAFYLRGRGADALSGIVRVEIEPEEYWLTTTTPADLPAWKAAREAFPNDLAQALSSLARRFPIGVREEAAGKSAIPAEPMAIR